MLRLYASVLYGRDRNTFTILTADAFLQTQHFGLRRHGRLPDYPLTKLLLHASTGNSWIAPALSYGHGLPSK